jgi:hypothetical protein
MGEPERRGPHAEWPRLAFFLSVEMECFAVVSLDMKDRHSGVWLVEGDNPIV